MQIGTEPGFSQIAVRDWYELLTSLKVANLRIAGAKPTDKIQIVTTGTERSPVYRVNARLTATGQLIVPGGRFTIRSRESLAKWIGELAKYGPDGPKVDTTGETFGLNDTQLRAIQRDLARSVNFSTVGLERLEIVTKLGERLKYEISLSNSSRASLQSAGTATFELKGVACGTALAYLIRAAGLGMAPRESLAGFEYHVAPADALTQHWPIGLKSKKRVRQLLPKSGEFVDFQINPQTPLATALPPMAEFLETTFLFDENLMVAAEIDPSRTLVEMAPTKTSLTIAADRIIAKARLRSELRVDEAGRAFYWITPQIIPRDR
ncbi:MAG: hypothetical protein MPJ50_01970 [Pirellulales bacterium]|nr:hypothetical protein [Pirellulales bacterium]